MNTQTAPGTTTATFQQLAFQLVNYAAVSSGTANIIYITSDASYNKIDLQIMVSTGSTTLTPGTIIDPNSIPPPGSGTVLYLDLTSLNLSTTLFNQLVCTADNWAFKLYPDDNIIGMTPTVDCPLSSGTTGGIPIHIAGLEIAQALPTPTVQLNVTYYNVTGITAESSTFAIALQNRPDVNTGNLPDAIATSVTPNTIINSYAPSLTVYNSFVLEFGPGTNQTQVLAGPDTVFTVSFVYGKPGDQYGYGALTDVTDGLNIAITAGDNASDWIITPHSSQQSPSWTLQPPDGAPLIGTGVQSIVSFNVGNILTPYQPGPTTMLVSYTGVPGYQPGVYTLFLTKVPHAIVDSLTISPNPAYFQNGQAAVTVEWQARYATKLILTQGFQQTDVTNTKNQQIPATLNQNTTSFSLTATGPGGDLDNSDIFPATAIVLPVINSFTGSPTEMYAGGTGQNVTFAWAVDTPGQITLTSSATPGQSESFSAQNSVSKSLTQPQMFTMTPVTQETELTLTRNLVISAFNLSAAQNFNLSATMSGVAVSPTAPFAALTDPAGNQVVIVDTVQYSQLSTVTVGNSPAGIVISEDGSLMVTANTGDNTLSLIDVTIAGGEPVFNVSHVSLTGAPQQVYITPDKSRLFISVDPGGGKTGQLVALKASGNTYVADAQAPVGVAPRGLAVDPSGARIFVANSADNTISVIGVQGDVLAPTLVIQSVTGTPTGLVITPDARQLLVTCPSANTVVAIDANNPNTATRGSLSVGNQPTQIALTPTGAYAFVTNQKDGTISMLGIGSSPTTGSVLGQPITVGTLPLGVEVSPDGLVVFIANSGGDNGLSVVTLQTYLPGQVASGALAQPTNVAAAPDGSSALAWHNAMIQSAVTGADCYSTSSQVLTPVLNGVPIIQCVYNPDPTAKQAFAIGNAGPGLYIIDTSNPADPTFTEQALTGAMLTLALAVSGDGANLFVVSSDQNKNYTLLVLSLKKGVWTTQQSIALYKAKGFGQLWLGATPDATTIFLADSGNQSYSTVSWNAGTESYDAASAPVSLASPMALTVLPDGSKAFILSAGAPNQITVIDVATLTAETLSLVQNYVQLQGLITSPDGRRLYGSDLSAGALRILDPASLRILQSLPLAPNISQAQGAAGLAITPNGSLILVANSGSGTLSIIAQVPMD